ncbi:hypothetical protein ABH940_001376 [Streptacidiphilus sp. BW17]|uniref:hypothetical protein n=1 Tax=Streptacidiphilus sp. BW17 TaxID=3156274 RepID=UPI0035111C52
MNAAIPGSGPVSASERARRRTIGLHRVSGVTRWTAIGSTAAALLLGLGYAHDLPNLSALGKLVPSHDGGGGSHTGNTGGSVGSTGGGSVQPPSQGNGGPAQTNSGAS